METDLCWSFLGSYNRLGKRSDTAAKPVCLSFNTFLWLLPGCAAALTASDQFAECVSSASFRQRSMRPCVTCDTAAARSEDTAIKHPASAHFTGLWKRLPLLENDPWHLIGGIKDKKKWPISHKRVSGVKIYEVNSEWALDTVDTLTWVSHLFWITISFSSAATRTLFIQHVNLIKGLVLDSQL